MFKRGMKEKNLQRKIGSSEEEQLISAALGMGEGGAKKKKYKWKNWNVLSVRN